MLQKSVLRWMAKNERISYGYWKKYLVPVLGKSVRKTDALIARLTFSHRERRMILVDKAIEKISDDMNRYESFNGAMMTYDYLRLIAVDHKKKLLRWRSR